MAHHKLGMLAGHHASTISCEGCIQNKVPEEAVAGGNKRPGDPVWLKSMDMVNNLVARVVHT